MIVTRQFEERGLICREILQLLPLWFGRPESNNAYVDRADSLPMYAAWEGKQLLGFVTLLDHNDTSTEIFVMGVDPGHHRKGIGRALIAAAVAYVKERAATILFVRTLGPSHSDRSYEATRRFYRAMGFLPVEELPDLWGSGTPSLLLVKSVAAAVPAGPG